MVNRSDTLFASSKALVTTVFTVRTGYASGFFAGVGGKIILIDTF